MDDDGPPGVPEWVVTYGDMMSLLLTFFIMLVSLSEVIAEKKYRAVLEALDQHMNGGYTTAPASPPVPTTQQMTTSNPPNRSSAPSHLMSKAEAVCTRSRSREKTSASRLQTKAHHNASAARFYSTRSLNSSPPSPSRSCFASSGS